MTIYRINPDLLKPEGASDGDVITYVSANSRVEWAAPTGGGGDVANVWVNANDYATYISITSNLNSVNSNVDSIAANLYNTYTTLTANDYSTLLAAQANDYNTYTTLTANDYNSYDTLTANIYNTFAYLNANVGGGGDASNAWVNANDYNTYTTLSSLIDTVQDNLTASGTTFYAEKFTIDGSTNSFTLNKSFNSEEAILVSIGGILQHSDAYTISGNTLTIANTIPLPVSTLAIRSYTSLSTSYASIDSDEFAIDGSTNSFTLSSNVSANSDILVSLSGVVQTPSQYVINNNQLTLSNTNPLPSGVLLEVRHLYATPPNTIQLTDLSVTTGSPSGNGALSYDNTSGVFTFTPADISTGGGGGGITTGKAIAMAMIFGG